MALRKTFKFRKISDQSTRRYYVRHFTGLDPALRGTPMDKERYLDAISAGSLDVVGVQSRRHRLM